MLSARPSAATISLSRSLSVLFPAPPAPGVHCSMLLVLHHSTLSSPFEVLKASRYGLFRRSILALVNGIPRMAAAEPVFFQTTGGSTLLVPTSQLPHVSSCA